MIQNRPTHPLSILLIRFLDFCHWGSCGRHNLSILLIRFICFQEKLLKEDRFFQFYWLDSPMCCLAWMWAGVLSILLIRFSELLLIEIDFLKELSILLIRFGVMKGPPPESVLVLSILLIRFRFMAPCPGRLSMSFQFYWLDSHTSG